MSLCDLSPAYIRSIAPYQPGKPISELAREIGLPEQDIVKLASNENPLGPSPRALAAIARALPDLALYPDGGGYALKAALAAKFGVGREQILLGNGSNDVLELAARTFLTPADSAVFSRHAFAVYPLATQAIGAQSIEVPAKQFGNDLAAIRAAIFHWHTKPGGLIIKPFKRPCKQLPGSSLRQPDIAPARLLFRLQVALPKILPSGKLP